MGDELTVLQEDVPISDGVSLKMGVDVWRGRQLDTSVVFEGGFVLEGERRREFAGRLAALVAEYRI